MAEDNKYKKINDSEHGIFINTSSKQTNTTAVSKPGKDENLDESYRDEDDKNFRPEFSNLKNTYFVTTNGHNARERFWGKQYSIDHSYRNNNGDIEDPIFTGFTLSIDKLTSPLFYTIGNYNGVADGRKDENGKTLERNIADEIENSLQLSYSGKILQALNSYEIIAALTKDKFPDNDREIGYGLQHNVYLDGLPYGATEYIYMVDKEIENQSTLQDTNGGIMSLGNGNKTQSAVSGVKDIDEKIDSLDDTISTYAGQITQATAVMNSNAVQLQHESNKATLYALNNEYEKYPDAIADINAKIESLKNSTTGSNVTEYEDAIKNKLMSKVTEMKNLIKKLKPDNPNYKRKQSAYNKVVDDINSCVNDLDKIINTYNGNTENVEKLKNKPNVDVKSCTITLAEVTNASDYSALPLEGGGTFDGSEAYSKGYPYTKITIKVTLTLSDKGEEQIRAYKQQIKELENKQKKCEENISSTTKKIQNDDYTKAAVRVETAQDKKKSAEDQKDTYENVKKAKSVGINPANDGVVTFSGDTTPTTKITGNINGKTNPAIADDISKQDTNKKTVARAPQTVYDMLNFIRGMKRLTEEYPYLMQSITGLDEAYKNNYVVKDSFRGSGDNKISISIYESLDLKISAMFNRYFNAVYDAQYRRERVPVNLRRFNCSIFVHDIRNFFLMTTQLGGKLRNLSKKNIDKIIEIALNSMSAIEFKFYGCEIVAEETGSIFETVSNADKGEMRMTNFVFTYSDCVVDYLPFEDLKRGAIGTLQKYPNGPHKPSVGSRISAQANKSKKQLQYQANGKVYDKNVFGFDNGKPTLSGYSGFAQDEAKIRSTNGNEIDDSIYSQNAALNGLNSHKTAPTQAKGKDELKKEGVKNYVDNNDNRAVLGSPLGNVDSNDSKEEGYVALNGNGQKLKPTASVTEDGLKFTTGGKVYKLTNEGFDSKNPKLNTGENVYDNNRTGVNESNGDTTPVDTEKVKLKYTSGNIGNLTVTDFDKKVPKLKSPLGNVRDGNKDEIERDEYDEISDKVVKTGYFDKSRLGNVNNDDYDEYRNRKLDKDYYDRLNEASSKERNNLANLNADASVNDNVQRSWDEVDRLLYHLKTSVLASLGEGVYDKYIDEIRHIVYPGYGTETVDDINYNSTPNARNHVPDLGTAELNGIRSRNVNGIVTKLGDVDDNDNLEDTPTDNFVPPIVQGTYTTTSSGIVSGLGDVLPDDPSVPNVGYIDDVLPDDPSVPNVSDIGNVYPQTETPDTQGYIDDVLPDDPSVPNVSNIGNVYPNLSTPATQGYIDDVIPDDPSVPNVKYIDDVIPDDKSNKTLTDIGNVYPTLGEEKIQGYIDDVIPDDEIGNKTESLGNLYEGLKDKPKIWYIDDIIPDDDFNNKLKKLDKLYDKLSDNPIITDLGKIKQ